MNNIDRNIRRILRHYEKSLESELLFDLDDLIDFANGRINELIEFLKNHEGEDKMGFLNVINDANINEEKAIKSLNKEEIIKELKIILKDQKPICLGVAYCTDDEETQEFIEFSQERGQVYIVRGYNPYSDSYDLEEEGEVVSLEELKKIVEEVARLTLESNLKKQEIINWLND